MTRGMHIALFGSSLVSAYWNGAATYYRGILRALALLGHRVTFYEPDAYDRQAHRDIDDPPWARVVVYQPTEDEATRLVERAGREADLLVKASGVGVLDDLLEQAVPAAVRAGALAAYWDVDAPATLARLEADEDDPLRRALGRYHIVFTYGGGDPVVRAYLALGARCCVPVYNALDPDTHHPVAPDQRFEGTLGLLANRLPDREARVEQFFCEAAARLPDERFLLGGSGWDDKPLPGNVHRLGHVYTTDHNAFNVSPLAVLNIARDSMARCGWSPATRVFEAAGAGACLVTDAWEGLEMFLEPGREALVARDGAEVAAHLGRLDRTAAREIGQRARRRVLAEHTYRHRAALVQEVLGDHVPATRGGPRRPRPRTDEPGAAVPAPPAPSERLDIVILGLSITSSWGNGHAVTWRSLVRELCARGHSVLFLERDAPWYADHRDLPAPPWGETALYGSVAELRARFAGRVRDADAVIVGSYVPDGIAVGDWVLDTRRQVAAFYDIDTPVTLGRLEDGDLEYLAASQVRRYDAYFSFSGGPVLQQLERRWGARRALPLHCAVDPDLYQPAQQAPRWDLGYMGTYSADRQPALERMLLEPARRRPEGRFVVAGPLYPETIRWPDNVERIPHLPPPKHRDFYTGLRFALNVTRGPMIAAGWSPSVRLFEAAACGVPIISDPWPGLEAFFTPGREVLVSRSPDDTLRYLRELDEPARRAIGARARARVLESHTAAHRAAALEGHLLELCGRRPGAATRLVGTARGP